MENPQLEAAISSLDARLQREVNEMVELVRLTDPDMSSDELDLLTHNFGTYKLFIKDGTHYALEGTFWFQKSVTDTVEIQLKIEKAKTDLVFMCYNFVRSYFVKAQRPRVVQLLDGFKRLQSRLATRRELGRHEHVVSEMGRQDVFEDDDEDDDEDNDDNDIDGEDGYQDLEDGYTEETGSSDGDATVNLGPTTLDDQMHVSSKLPTLSSISRRSGKNRKKRTKRRDPAVDLSVQETATMNNDDSVAADSKAPESNNAFYDSEQFRTPADKESKIAYVKRKYSKYRAQCTKQYAWELVTRKMPILRWFPYFYFSWLLVRKPGEEAKRAERKKQMWFALSNIRSDLLAAITVGFMLIPQGMSYALVAELPPIYGLYSALVPLAVYTFFGSSAELAVGPTAMVSLLIPEAASTIAEKGTDDYVEAAILISALSGLLLICGSFLRVGFILENLLSHPVLSGFTSGAAVLIILSQLQHLFRIKMKGNTLFQYLEAFFSNASEIHLWTTVLGLLCLGFIIILQRLQPRLPGSLILLLLTTLLSWALNLSDNLGLATVGTLPTGLPSPSWLHALSWDNVLTAAPAAATVALLGFIEAISVAKQFAAKRQYRIDVSQELLALGLSNFTGAFFRSYPVTGSLSRSAVNFQAGSRSPFSSFLAACLIGITLLFLTPVFKYTPLFMLAAIVVAAAMLLIDYREVIFLVNIGDRVDLCQTIIVFIVTLCLGPEMGVICAISVSLLALIFKSAKPNFPRVGRLPGTLVYKDIKRFPSAMNHDGILVVRFDSDLFFANVNWFRQRLNKYERKCKRKLHAVVLDATGINSLDSTSIHLLEELSVEFKTKKIRFLWANVKDTVLDTLESSGLSKQLGVDNFFLTTHDAVDYMLTELEDRGLLHSATQYEEDIDDESAQGMPLINGGRTSQDGEKGKQKDGEADDGEHGLLSQESDDDILDDGAADPDVERPPRLSRPPSNDSNQSERCDEA